MPEEVVSSDVGVKWIEDDDDDKDAGPVVGMAMWGSGTGLGRWLGAGGTCVVVMIDRQPRHMGSRS